MPAKPKKQKGRRAEMKTLQRPQEEIQFDDPLLTPEQTAKRLGVAVDSLAIWRCTEKVPLPYTRIGRLIRYFSSDVEAYARARRVTPATTPERATA